jgi:xylulokinase
VRIFLGLDCSTQGFSAVALAVEGTAKSIVATASIDFDLALPHYGTSHGVLRPSPNVVVAPPLMWAEALDSIMSAVAKQLEPRGLAAVAAVSGSAQQHGSVYLGAAAAEVLSLLVGERPLVRQIRGMLSRDVAPVWMDTSTAEQCDAITRAAGGAEALARATGSRAFERFTGPQIRKFFEEDPEAYGRTDRIHLVSSFLASLLAGHQAPVDRGDASGTNLMDIARATWDARLLRATAPDLERRLPEIVPSSADIGRLAGYWQHRYGFPPARIVAWSGDNPCSLIGVGLVNEGRRAVSLGTSDTVFGYLTTPAPDPSGGGHVFAAPTGDYMGLTCFKNGSLARERVRDRFALHWAGFSAILRSTPPGNDGGILLPWFEPEITPPVHRPGERRFGIEDGDRDRHVRGVVEGQMLAMARHSAWMGAPVRAIHATGGASVNREILQVMADVFDADVHPLPVENSAALGAALRAHHADACARGEPIAWQEVVEGLAAPVPGSRIAPDPAAVAVYRQLARVHEACEREALQA